MDVMRDDPFLEIVQNPLKIMSIRNDFFQDQGGAILRWGVNRSQGTLSIDVYEPDLLSFVRKKQVPWPVDLCI
jgi:hypothetical protein